MIIIGFVIWYIVGIYGCIIDYRKFFDIRVADLFLFITLFWVIGPFLLLFHIPFKNKVLIKKYE